MLAVLTTYFNPLQYESKFANFYRFMEGMKAVNADVFIAEIVFNGICDLEDFDVAVRLEGNDNNVMWQKERLLNILLDRLPEKYDAVAWIDGDILFDDEEWQSKTMKMLETHDVVHMFSVCRRLGESQNRLQESIISAGEYMSGKTASGFAWAARRPLLADVGFLDRNILGGADTVMAQAFIGSGSPSYAEQNPALLSSYNELWVARVRRLAPRTTSAKWNISHLFHGYASKRKYIRRKSILATNGFDPDKDTKVGDNKLLEWTGNKPRLQLEVKNYLLGREEDEDVLAHRSRVGRKY